MVGSSTILGDDISPTQAITQIAGKGVKLLYMVESRSSKIILLLEPDDDVRPLLKESLELHGYHVVLAWDMADASERVQTVRPNLILLNQNKQSIEAVMNIGQQIRQNVASIEEMTAEIPIVVIAEQYGAEQEGTDVQLGENEYITYLEDGQQLINLLQRLCEQ
jgi:CheY-like chemotaxis protein